MERARVRRELAVRDDEILIGLVARMDPMKDHPTFLRAAMLLARQRSNVRFVCIGEGGARYENELRRLGTDLGLDGKVIWAGGRHDIPALCNALDLATSSSYSEGFSNTIAEAMACGVPCVVTNVGDSALIVADTGAIVPPSDPEALCAGFLEMLDKISPVHREAVRQSIVGRFKHDVMVSSTVAVLGRLKVLLLARALGIGGTERQLVLLAKGLQERHHDVTVAVFYSGGPLEQELHDAGVAVCDLQKAGRWDLLSFTAQLLRLVWRRDPEIIYAFLGTANIIAALLKVFFPGVRMVWGVRASNVDLAQYDWLSRLSYRIECRLSAIADLVICNSNAGRAYAVANGFPRSKTAVVPNGIDVARFQPRCDERARVRREWNIADDEVLIGLVARLDPMKDHETFLRAARALAAERDDVRFVCVGDGTEPYKTESQDLATELGLDPRLIWAGARTDMAAVCNALDVGASSSAYGEGFSNTIAEAMACGVPCVVTDVGDSARVVDDTGSVVPPSDPESFARGLRQVLARLGPELRVAARATIVTRFSHDAMVDGTVALLWAMK